VQTFFGGVTTGALQSNAVLYAADDEELLGFPGWAEP
jgi:hypothetical protein